MSVFKDRGVVIKEYFSGEYDKNIVLLLKERGRVTAFVKGARKPKSKYHAGTQLFSYCEFVIYEGSGFLSVTQVDIIDNFYGIGKDYEKFCLSSYFLELINTMLFVSMPVEPALYLLIKSLRAMAKGVMDKNLICSVFEFKFMQIEGYSPQLDDCVICGKAAGEEKGLFFSDQGIICRDCVHNERNTVPIDNRTVFIIKYILQNEIKDLFKINVSADVLRNLKEVSGFFVENNVDGDFKSQIYLK